jgi:diguanylate cyclase (GGDEF)-like protein
MNSLLEFEGLGAGPVRTAEIFLTWASRLRRNWGVLEGTAGTHPGRTVRTFRLAECGGALLLDAEQSSPDAALPHALAVLELVAAVTVARLEAAHDPLTGLANRRLLAERLEGAIEEGNRYGTTFSLAMLDMDNFKWFNDTYGHSEGDEVLKGFAAVLRARVRRADVVARYGGDEFVVLLPHTSADDAAGMLARIESELERYMERYDAGEIRLGFSFGLAHHPEDGRDADALVRRADERLYEAKLSAGLGAR